MRDAEISKQGAGNRDEEIEEGEGDQEHRRVCLFPVSESCQLRCVLAGICSIPHSPSAAGWSNAAGTVSATNSRSSNPPQDTDHLPPLEELFGDLQGDDYIERLEELAESLLREVTTEVEANANRTSGQVSVEEDSTEKRDHSKGMVGQTSEDVEADGTCRSLNVQQPWHPVSSTASTHYTTRSTVTTTPMAIKSEVEVKQEAETHDLDTIYGTYDEATNSVTIIYPGEETSMGIQECMQEVVTDCVSSTEEPAYLTSNYYTGQLSPYTSTESMSPLSIHSEDTDGSFAQKKLDCNASDYGYESHGSPNSDARNEKHSLGLTDLWHESFSELFPTLA